MPTIQELDAEIAKRQRIADIDALIQEKQGTTIDSFIEPLQAIGGGLLGEIGAGLSGIKELISTGDLSSAVNEINRIQQKSQQVFAPQTEAGQQGLQNVAGAIGAIDENIIRPAVAGTSGLLNVVANPIDNLTTGFEPARREAALIQERGFGKVAGQEVFERTGSPLLATVAEVSPDIAGVLVPGGAAKSGVSSAVAKSRLRVGDAEKAVKAANDVRSGKVAETSVQDVANAVKQGSEEDIAAIVQADPKFYQAVDALGIDAEPLASFASKNPQFRSISNALEVAVGSELEPQAFRFIEATAKAADDLITNYGGTIDKAQLGLDFKRDALKNIENLYDSTDDVYGQLRNIVDEKQRFAAPATVAFLEELQAADKLSPKLASVLKQLKPRDKKTQGNVTVNPATGARIDSSVNEVINPKLGRIDILRRQFGQAVGKGSGAFKDQETGLNKAIYARLTGDLDGISESIGGDALALSDAGKGLVRQRKQLEDNLTSLLGKDLNQALSVNVGGAIKNLSKGEVDRFSQVVNAIPKQQRSSIILSSMNDVFKGNAVGKQAFDATQFTKWYQTINRSPAAKKALFDNLPKESKVAIDNLFEVSRGISRSLGQKRATGISKLFDQDVGLIRKLLGSSAVKAAIALKGGPVGSAASSQITELFSQATDQAKTATSLLASDNFKEVVRQSVKEGVFDGNKASEKLKNAEKQLMKSTKYKKWLESLDDKAGLAGGLIGYLSTQQQENN
jgi:hypothetical protein